MKAVRAHGVKDLRYEDVPDPVVTDDDVLIRVKAVGICGTDIEIYHGEMFYITGGLTALPLIPAKGLRISWATPAVKLPIAANFSDWISPLSNLFRSVISP